MLVSVNPETPLSWVATTMPVIDALAAAVPGPILSVHAEPISAAKPRGDSAAA